MMTLPAVHLFIHVPKTGGQTLRNLFSQRLGHGRGFVHLGPWGDVDRDHRSLPSFEEMSPEQLRQVRCVLGHRVKASTAGRFPDRDVRWVCFFRDPASRLASLYNFNMRKWRLLGRAPVDFKRFLEQRVPNPQLRFAASSLDLDLGPDLSDTLDEVIERLESFRLVGTTESMDDLLPLILADMGLPPTLPARANQSGVDHERLVTADDPLVVAAAHEDALDLALHRHAQTLTDERLRLVDGHPDG